MLSPYFDMLRFRTVRSAKLAASTEAYSFYGENVELIVIDDIVRGSYPDAFKGECEYQTHSLYGSPLTPHSAGLTDVHGIIHTAAPLVGKAASAQEAIDVRILSPCQGGIVCLTSFRWP